MRYIALLRGINVGGKSMMKMDELKAVFKELGFENVKSYINSGNIAFDTQGKGGAGFAEKIEKQLERAVEEKFTRPVPVMVRSQKDIERIMAANPFKGVFADHKTMHVLFLKQNMPESSLKELKAAALADEGYEAIDREIYAHLPHGVADSLLGKNFLEKKLKISATGRNWRTIEKIAAL